MNNATTEWLEILARLVLKDKGLHDATVALILAAAVNEQSKADWRNSKSLRLDAELEARVKAAKK